jgi:hypothetical protein
MTRARGIAYCFSARRPINNYRTAFRNFTGRIGIKPSEESRGVDDSAESRALVQFWWRTFATRPGGMTLVEFKLGEQRGTKIESSPEALKSVA